MLRVVPDLCSKLSSCDLHRWDAPYVVGETITPAIEEGDLIILASASGRAPNTCHYAKIAKQAGADIFIITAESESAITDISPADIILHAATKDNSVGSQQIMGSLFEQALLLFGDMII